MATIVKAEEAGVAFSFVCDDQYEIYRAKTLFQKEEGTIRWLRESIKPGDVVYDIGANIGPYTLVAAGLGAMVYAFEPHVANACSLLRNVARNTLASQVKFLTCALHEQSEFLDFNYRSKRAGSSGSQLGHTTGEDGQAFTPLVIEVKYATSVNHLVGAGAIKAPALVKLDVDGNEWPILLGMQDALPGMRSIQVEISPAAEHRHTDDIIALLEKHGFCLTQRHHSQNALRLIKKGADPNQVTHNAIFTRQ